MSSFLLVSDSRTRPVTWKETFAAVFNVKDHCKMAAQFGSENTVMVSKPKAIAITVLSFAIAIVALAVLAVAIGLLFTVPVLTPLAVAAATAAAIGLSKGALIAIVAAAGTFLLGGLIVGSCSADVLRRGVNENQSQLDLDDI